MQYRIFGPVELPRNEYGLLTRDAGAKAEFWNYVDGFVPSLSEACGCYVISVRSVVWYVGVAARQPFKRECFAPHTITKIDEAISRGKGNAMLHFLAKITPQGRFAHPSPNGHRSAAMLETLFIGIGLQRNEHLLNKSDTAILREIVVPGFYNSPQGSARASSVQALKRVMGV
ncbi:MAG TPA: hypothetical protein VL171_06780 [Verrucomicrobiae bacterium]|nr:hypothetical protein [Verrucomicrobiae bacterium]